jgi:8-oxo-dGTP pyrophosphatase MutT (NUDIX family)
VSAPVEASELARARATIAAVEPRDAAQAEARAFMLAFVDAHPDALLRTCLEGHLTAAALVVDAAGERALLTLHRKLGKWLQLGGHCDGQGDLGAAALREATEESGIDGLVLEPAPIDLDVHRIPARPGEPEHWHLDTRFVARAPAGAREEVSDESHALAWFTPAEARRAGVDASVTRLLDLVLGRD